MSQIFPPPVLNLPEAEIPIRGARAHLCHCEHQQILFMEFTEDADLPEHSHAAQFGIVLEGRIDLVIGKETRCYFKGDRYFLPAGVPHSGKIHAGYADVTFFDEPRRYEEKGGKTG